tara:strand:+ start:14706 stop:15695 length:990 start_codon:yes stop_codon:yes gene_type:complete
MTKKLIFYYFLILIIVSCEPKEYPINIQGLVNYVQVNLGSDYCNQIYYDIDDNIVISENLITEWDIAFYNEINAIKINSAKYMRLIGFESILNFENIDNIIENNDWLYDDPSGDIQLLAFNNNSETLSKNFFLVDLGYDCYTNHLGYSIIQIIDFDEDAYIIQIIDLDQNNNLIYNDIIEIEKNNKSYLRYFSLINKNFMNNELSTWDLMFTRYTEFNVIPPGGINLNPLPTYRVVGVLQNYSISVAVDTLNDFSDINITNINNYNFSENSNTIGYDWKFYNSDLGIYSINSPVYLIKSQNNNYYKLLFLDFYSESGEKGSPTFQIEKL